MVEETEYDDVVECKHSYSQRCHTTYTTDFEPQQVRINIAQLVIFKIKILNCQAVPNGIRAQWPSFPFLPLEFAALPSGA